MTPKIKNLSLKNFSARLRNSEFILRAGIVRPKTVAGIDLASVRACATRRRSRRSGEEKGGEKRRKTETEKSVRGAQSERTDLIFKLPKFIFYFLP